jgi:hypothetical protein
MIAAALVLMMIVVCVGPPIMLFSLYQPTLPSNQPGNSMCGSAYHALSKCYQHEFLIHNFIRLDWRHLPTTQAGRHQPTCQTLTMHPVTDLNDVTHDVAPPTTLAGRHQPTCQTLTMHPVTDLDDVTPPTTGRLVPPACRGLGQCYAGPPLLALRLQRWGRCSKVRVCVDWTA